MPDFIVFRRANVFLSAQRFAARYVSREVLRTRNARLMRDFDLIFIYGLRAIETNRNGSHFGRATRTNVPNVTNRNSLESDELMLHADGARLRRKVIQNSFRNEAAQLSLTSSAA